VLFKIPVFVCSRLYFDNGQPATPLPDNDIESPSLIGMTVLDRHFPVNLNWFVRHRDLFKVWQSKDAPNLPGILNLIKYPLKPIGVNLLSAGRQLPM